MIKSYIYILTDPISYEIRYVGKSVNPKGRLSSHLYLSRLDNKEHKSNWIKKLKRSGLIPIMDIVQEIDEKYWQECEIYWISYFKSMGCPLTNTDLGGKGMKRGYKPSKASIEKQKRTMRKKRENGYKQSKESIRKNVETRRKNGSLKHSKETRKKLSIAARNRKPISEETRMRLSESHSGKKATKEARLKLSIANVNRKKVYSSSGFKGVSWCRQKTKWRVRFAGKYIGVFEDKIQAAKAYDCFLIDKFGKENCTTNKDLNLY